jgi:hypothetical protein
VFGCWATKSDLGWVHLSELFRGWCVLLGLLLPVYALISAIFVCDSLFQFPVQVELVYACCWCLCFSMVDYLLCI